MKTEVELGGETYTIIDGELDLNNTQVTDLSPLKGLPLTVLGLRNTQVTDLSPLEGMPLEVLYLDNTPAAKNPLPQWLDTRIVFGL